MPLQLKGPVSIDELAEILYEPIGEPLARVYGKAGALTFYHMMGEEVQNFWRGIAKQLIDHSREWQDNVGCCCILSDQETQRLKRLPRVPKT
jgi:hypothetical protein